MRGNDCASKHLIMSPILGLVARIVIYAVAVAGLTQLIVVQAVPDHGDTLYAEDSLIEWLHMAVIALTVVVLNRIAASDPTKRPLAILMAGLLLAAAVRELDWAMDDYVFDGAWQLVVVCILVVTAVLTVGKYRKLAGAVRDFASKPSFGIMLSGFLIVFVFSRLFGQTSFWRTIMGDAYLFSVKNAAEEGTELLGYFFLLIGAVEWLCTCRTSRETKSGK